jgi:hypothetical protein
MRAVKTQGAVLMEVRGSEHAEGVGGDGEAENEQGMGAELSRDCSNHDAAIGASQFGGAGDQSPRMRWRRGQTKGPNDVSVVKLSLVPTSRRRTVRPVPVRSFGLVKTQCSNEEPSARNEKRSRNKFSPLQPSVSPVFA